MKKIILSLVAVAISHLFTFSQGWQWLNPLPQGNHLYDIKFIDANTGFAVGECGTIMKTINGGATWAFKNIDESYILRSVFFTDANTGYIVGHEGFWTGGGIILKTIDGGENWTLQQSPLYSMADLFDVYFTDQNTGYAVGYVEQEYIVTLKTIDGGENWALQTPWILGCLNSVFFTDDNTGYVVGGNSISGTIPGEILKTIDGGENWISKFQDDELCLNSVFFTEENIGYAVGQNNNMQGIILKTTDGGETWLSQTTEISGLKSVYFTSVNTGYVAGWEGVFKTTDGGETWIIQTTDSPLDLNSICFINDINGYAVGYNGRILKTSNGGIEWTCLTSYNNLNSLRSVFFTGTNKGYAVGGDYGGSLLITLDGGENWSAQYYDTLSLNSVYFPNEEIGYVVGRTITGKGVILKTTDSGLNWSCQVLNDSNYLQSVFFVNSELGYCVGSGDINNVGYGGIYKTTDGGTTWITQYSSTTKQFYSVFFVDENTGFVVGSSPEHGIILKTSDGGLNWINQYTTDLYSTIRSVHFPTINTGYACAWWSYGYGLYKTTDGGENWIPLDAGGDYVYFVNENTGYVIIGSAVGIAVPPYFFPGVIQKTTDGGISWTTQKITSNWLNSVYFTDENTGYIVGDGGTILKTTNGGATGIDEFENVSTSKPLKIYPNPSNDKITISSSSITSNTKLSIFNVNGEKVLERQLTHNETQIDISALPRGVYFVRLQSEKMVEVGKMVKE